MKKIQGLQAPHGATSPNILFSVRLCARLQQDLREVHLIVVKRIFIYLMGTPNLGLYFKHSKEFKLISDYDADYASDKLERRSTICWNKWPRNN